MDERLLALMRPCDAELRPNSGPPVSREQWARWWGQWLWAALMLSHKAEVAAAILDALPVRAGNLDAVVLRRALRGGRLPSAEDYLIVTPAMLAAAEEAGSLRGNRRAER